MRAISVFLEAEAQLSGSTYGSLKYSVSSPGKVVSLRSHTDIYLQEHMASTALTHRDRQILPWVSEFGSLFYSQRLKNKKKKIHIV